MLSRILLALPGQDLLRRVQPHLPPLNFITLHYLYFIVTCAITSLIFWGSSTPARSISYTDSLFMVISAMTEAGLNTVDLSELNTFQQCLLWLHIMAGSAIFVSLSVVHVRKASFEARFSGIVKAQKEQRIEHRRTFSENKRQISPASQSGNQEIRHDISSIDNRPTPRSGDTDDLRIERLHDTAASDELQHVPTLPGNANSTTADSSSNGDFQHPKQHRIAFGPSTHHSNMPHDQVVYRRRHSQVLSFNGVGAAPSTPTQYRRPGRDNSIYQNSSRQELTNHLERKATWHGQHFMTDAVVGRNSQFHGLSREEREHLGGVEYRAISLLAWVVPVYFVLWQLLGCLGLGAWMANNKPSVARENGINPWWLGAFNAVSAFNNSGMSLLDANMIPFNETIYPLLTMGLLILAGNTAYPVFLRLILWTMHRCLPKNTYYQDWKDTLRFTLDHPRRVYTNLFPSTPTWWLVFALVVLNGIDWAAFELLNIGNADIEKIPRNARVLDGLFQALAVRSGGFYVVPIPSLRIGVQVLYVIMMYISVYPVVITMRNSNVYEERSLGIYAEEGAERNPEKGFLGRFRRRVTGREAGESRRYFLRQQVRGQLAHDLSWLVVAILFIVCIEVSNFERDPITYSVFNVMFEVVSGYGCVGISTGLPNASYSFSGGWHVTSKLILCAVMLRGRHRGLPVAIDRAVLLPREGLGVQEEEDHELHQSSLHGRFQEAV